MMVLNTALEKYSKGKEELSSDMGETAFALFHEGETFGKYQNSWEFIENDGEGERKGWRQRNFVQFMDFIKEIFQLEKTMLEVYDWEGAGNARVVDVSTDSFFPLLSYSLDCGQCWKERKENREGQ